MISFNKIIKLNILVVFLFSFIYINNKTCTINKVFSNKVNFNSNEKILLNNPRIIVYENRNGIDVINKNFSNLKNNLNNKINTKGHYKYYIKDIESLGKHIDKNYYFGGISGNSGVTLFLNFCNKTLIYPSISTTLGINNKSILKSFGLDKGFYILADGKYTVPSNIKDNKGCILTAYPLFKKYKFNLYLKNKLSLKDTYIENGYIYIPIGIHYDKKNL